MIDFQFSLINWKSINMRVVYSLALISLLASLTSNVSAHPGRTAKDGCHYCRTNCDYWGVPYGERHCHFYEEPTEEELIYSKLVKRYSDEKLTFVTLLHNETWSTYETSKLNNKEDYKNEQ